jgi:hypothetical protein
MSRVALLLIAASAWCGCDDDVVFRQDRLALKGGEPTVKGGLDDAAIAQDAVGGFEPAGRWVIERFQAPNVKKIDLLWVIDSSGSMDEEQRRIAGAVARFAEVLETREVDARLAVTTMEMAGEQAGCLKQVDGRRWFDIATDPVQEVTRFRTAVQVGASDGTVETGLLAGLVAASGDRPCNQGFRRPDASLAFIFVSDEDDQSPMTLGTARRWARIYNAASHAVVGDDRRALVGAVRGCISPDPNPETPFAELPEEQRRSLDTIAVVGQRYRALAATSGGVSVSICAEDFAGPLAQVALAAAGVQQRYRLRLEPDWETLSVQVDETPSARSEVGMGSGWWYEAETNSILFGSQSIPEWPARISVRYLAAE